MWVGGGMRMGSSNLMFSSFWRYCNGMLNITASMSAVICSLVPHQRRSKGAI